MSSENIWYEIIVTDEKGDRHRHLTDILPSKDEEEYMAGELTIDLSDNEQITYMLGKIISWSWREIDLTDDIPTLAETEIKL